MARNSINFIVLLTFLSTICEGYLYKTDQPFSEGQQCPLRHGFPPSTCRRAENCDTLMAYKEIEKTVAVCGFEATFGKELLCCPNEFPAGYVKPTFPITLYKHLATLAYLKPITLDDHVYRCTAVVLSPTQILVSSKCVGQKAVDKPAGVLLGVSDPRDSYSFSKEFKHTSMFNHDLTLFALYSPIEFNKNVSTATLCTKSDLEGNPKLHAVAYSQYANGTSCGMFLKQLVKHNDCSRVQNERQVENLRSPGLHLCVQPMQTAGIDFQSSGNENGACLQCLTASSSVLHVERADGSVCVAGIATPTTDKCIVNGNPLYYTIIVNSTASDFIKGHV